MFNRKCNLEKVGKRYVELVILKRIFSSGTKKKSKDDIIMLILTFRPAVFRVVNILMKVTSHIENSSLIDQVLPKLPPVTYNPNIFKGKLVQSKFRTNTKNERKVLVIVVERSKKFIK